MEIWENITEDGKFQVSNLGRVRRQDYTYMGGHGRKQEIFVVGGIIPQTKNNQGYVYSFIRYNGKQKRVRVHKLVAEAFIDNPNNYNDINHINGIKDDNRVENLEWCTRSQNLLHSYNVLGNVAARGEETYISKLTDDGVKEIKKRLNNNETSYSISKDFNVQPSTIRAIKNNITWKHIKI